MKQIYTSDPFRDSLVSLNVAGHIFKKRWENVISPPICINLVIRAAYASPQNRRISVFHEYN